MKRVFKSLIAVSFAFIAASCGNKSNYDPNDWWTPGGENTEEEENVENVVNTDGALKLMSFNVRYANANDGANNWDNRKSDLYTMIKTEKPFMNILMKRIEENPSA